MMDGLLNIIRREVLRVMGSKAVVRVGTVESYDPGAYAVRVRLQPEGALTGWLPIGSAYMSSGGGGMFTGLAKNQVVDVHFQEGNPDAGYVVAAFPPVDGSAPEVPEGECWIVAPGGGATLKFAADGSLTVEGNLTVTGTITCLDMNIDTVEFKNLWNTHRHQGPGSGTGPPMPQYDLP